MRAPSRWQSSLPSAVPIGAAVVLFQPMHSIEWKPVAGRKQPYCVRMADGSLFGMAGLWEHWVDSSGQTVESCTIITTEANTLINELHERMPAILAPGEYATWLQADNTQAEVLLKPFPPEQMSAYPVTLRVNNVKNDDAACLAPLVT